MIKRTLVTLLTLLIVFTTVAQDITGKWNGLLEVPGSPLRLVFNISESDSGYSSTLDSPDQGALGIPVNSTIFKASKLDIAVTALGLTYAAEFIDGKFEGTFTQGGFTLPLALSRETIEKPALNRPQEPKEPYPYYSEEVSFKNNQENITLAGTLTLPEETGTFPVVVMITGSGPQNRNEELARHKPFLVISDYLTKNGIGVLRYDDRGAGKSTGDFAAATSVDFASDVESAIAYLKTRKEVDKKNIGLIGHSEGGVIAPMVASRSKDVKFIVLMAGTGIPGSELLSLQGRLIAQVMGDSESEIEKSAEIRDKMIAMTVTSKDLQTLRDDLNAYLKGEAQNDEARALVPEGTNVEQFIKAQVDFMATPWMVYFLRHNPAKVLEKVSCPVLAINGDKDLQVPAEENLSAMAKALEKAGNKNVTLKTLSGLNHLFQESETGSPVEYAAIEQTFSPKALKEISDWILKQVE
ncbi:alpha/beta fold hydrolase [uncultured Kriegella sp.]|mgnify:CR=1 FL=1|uniref:alpha/beta hydrolase family protein n=1 Tax=uncultured Kriegella sp. TaxID=1798910 RepID=UPI0030DDABFD|tara:strand:+ start:271526 stop:272929 length:1404 start_codon:yes stop_codon:yes gene_type:complete